MASSKQLYDIDAYAKKARTALEKLEKTQQPGEVTGKGGKADVIRAIKSDLEALIKKGYTSKQIADALKHDDVFGILPKTITEIVAGKKQNKSTVTRKKKSTTPAPTASGQANTAPIPQAGTFTVKPDSEDL